MFQPHAINFSTLEGLTHVDNPYDCFKTSSFPSAQVTFEGSDP